MVTVICLFWNGGATSGMRLSFFGLNNRVIVNKSARICNLEIHIVASGLNLEIHEGVQIANGYFWLGGDNAKVIIGANTYLINNSINLTDSNARLDIGPGCMLGAGAQIRLGDGHTLYDARDGTVLNKGHHVVLEANVWLAQDALILKDVVIGAGSVIGARSVVTRDIPAGCVAAGIPARVVRRDVNWHREKIDNLPEAWFRPELAPP